jgi:hypothetical protein
MTTNTKAGYQGLNKEKVTQNPMQDNPLETQYEPHV